MEQYTKELKLKLFLQFYETNYNKLIQHFGIKELKITIMQYVDFFTQQMGKCINIKE